MFRALISELGEDAVGNAGDINITAGDLSLNDSVQLLAITKGRGNAGNINLNISDRIILNGNNAPARPSEFDFDESILNNLEEKTGIFANTNNDTLSDGGDININSNFIIAFPGGNSDIVANAQQGRGGNINITTESLLGIEARKSTPENTTNDIDASSDFGLDGTVNITTPDINLLQGATELPSNVVEPEQTTAQACQSNRETVAKNGFTINGKGGIPAEPGLPLNSLNISINGQFNSASIPQPITTSQGKIKPARGIKVTESGEIILTAYSTNDSGERIPKRSSNCGHV